MYYRTSKATVLYQGYNKIDVPKGTKLIAVNNDSDKILTKNTNNKISYAVAEYDIVSQQDDYHRWHRYLFVPNDIVESYMM
jgi:hypothetical protein